MKNSEDLESACGQLAEYLQSRQEALISEWVTQVRADSGVPSDSMTKPEIIDHVPMIFEAILHALRQQCGATAAQVQEIAARHTIIRWVQGYDLHAVLREVSLLRAALIHYSHAFEDEHQHISNDARLFTSTTIHHILDDLVMDATDTFLTLRARADRDEV